MRPDTDILYAPSPQRYPWWLPLAGGRGVLGRERRDPVVGRRVDSIKTGGEMLRKEMA